MSSSSEIAPLGSRNVTAVVATESSEVLQYAVYICISACLFLFILRHWISAHRQCKQLLYPPSERSETGGCTVFTFVCLCVCLCALSAVFNSVSVPQRISHSLGGLCTLWAPSSFAHWPTDTGPQRILRLRYSIATRGKKTKSKSPVGTSVTVQMDKLNSPKRQKKNFLTDVYNSFDERCDGGMEVTA